MNIDLLRDYLADLYDKLDSSRPDMGDIEQGLLSNIIEIADSMSEILYKCENELVIDFEYIESVISDMSERADISIEDARRIFDGRPDSTNDILENSQHYINEDIKDAVVDLLEFYDKGMEDAEDGS
jgi:hypothetical protein